MLVLFEDGFPVLLDLKSKKMGKPEVEDHMKLKTAAVQLDVIGLVSPQEIHHFRH